MEMNPDVKLKHNPDDEIDVYCGRCDAHIGRVNAHPKLEEGELFSRDERLRQQIALLAHTHNNACPYPVRSGPTRETSVIDPE